MLRTRAPVVSGKASFSLLPLDLHVLGLPTAFVLSQDQTLKLKYDYSYNLDVRTSAHRPPVQRGHHLNRLVVLKVNKVNQKPSKQ